MAVFCVDTGSVGMYRCRLGADSQCCRKPPIFWSLSFRTLVQNELTDPWTSCVGGSYVLVPHGDLCAKVRLSSKSREIFSTR